MTTKFSLSLIAPAAAAFLAFATSSCVNQEADIFDRSAAERLELAKSEYTKLLCSATNGWEMQYFADNDVEGGFIFLMKFNPDASVTIAGNNKWIGNTYKEETSLYQMISDDGPVLSFNSYNTIFHFLADPYDIPSTEDDEAGSGHKGDYEFIVMEGSADHIRLRGKKTGITITLTALPAETDWKNYLADVKAKGAAVFNSRFDPLLLQLNDSVAYMVSNGKSGVFNAYPKAGDPITQTTTHPFLFNAKGILFKSPFEDSDVVQLVAQPDGTFSIDGIEGGGLFPTSTLAESLTAIKFTWRITADAAGGKFADILARLAEETKTKLKKNFNSIDIVYVASENKYALSFRNSGTSAAAYIYGDMDVDAADAVKMNFSTTDGNTNGKNRLRDLPTLVELINALNAGKFSLATANRLAPTTIRIKTSDADYIDLTLQ